MIFDPPLVRGTLVRRYKRFLADITLENGNEVTVHCPNPGAMLGLDQPGSPVWVAPAKPTAKLPYGWKLIGLPTGLVGIDTMVPNRVVKEALTTGAIEPLLMYRDITAEVKYGENSRIDFLLKGNGLPDCYLEVKNVHLCRQSGLAEFPDCVTKRGAKHLDELANMVRAGHRAVMLYLVQRGDCVRFRLADDLDPGYATAFAAAKKAGVEAYCYSCDITEAGVALGKAIQVEL